MKPEKADVVARHEAWVAKDESAKQKRRDALARILCAQVMNLHTDALGENLPDDMWQRFYDRADAIICLTKRRE
jgi:hypothetical protein